MKLAKLFCNFLLYYHILIIKLSSFIEIFKQIAQLQKIIPSSVNRRSNYQSIGWPPHPGA
jgi:hypothetical protein